MNSSKIVKSIKTVLLITLMYETIIFTNYALNKNCMGLYFYSENDLSNIYKNKSRENLWFIAQKIEIMDVCKQRNYKNFLKEVSQNHEVVDFRGYDWVSKGEVSLSDLATSKLENLK